MDYLILLLAFITSAGFMLLGIHRIFNFYIGVILMFFIFLTLNLEIKLALLEKPTDIGFWQEQFLSSKEFYLNLAIFLIPIIGIILSFFTCKSKRNILIGALYGFFIPFFFTGILAYIWKNIALDTGFINYISNIFIDSIVFDFFYNNTSLFFFIVIFAIFSKVAYYIGKIVFYFIVWYLKTFTQWLLKIKKKDEN